MTSLCYTWQGACPTGSSSGGSSGSGSGSGSGGPNDGGVPTDTGPNSGCSLKTPDAGLTSYACTSPIVLDLSAPSSVCRPDDAGALPQAVCDMLCQPGGGGLLPLSCSAYDDANGGHVLCNYPCPGGRRPEGLIDDAAYGPDSVARHLAQMAHLEAASVDAFERLARELRVYQAPARLCGESRRAARDEVRHARVIGRLAKRAGATVPAARVEPCAVRSLEAIAVENAVEGCVRETFGAAVALFQANRAADGHVRRAMKGIARDETRHAELSWKLASWLDKKLDSGARARVKRARTQAVAALAREVTQATDRALNVALGIPTAAEARALIDNLRAPLWS